MYLGIRDVHCLPMAGILGFASIHRVDLFVLDTEGGEAEQRAEWPRARDRPPPQEAGESLRGEPQGARVYVYVYVYIRACVSV
jgi:hypothetical protein